MDNDRKPIPKTIFDDIKLRLVGPWQDGAKRPPNLRFGWVNNNPRLTVFTNIENAGDKGMIQAPMSMLDANGLLIQVRRVAQGENGVHMKMSNKTGAPGKQTIVSYTHFGKDDKGLVYISVIAQDRPKIKFVFLPSDWHELTYADGTELDKSRLSADWALSWCNTMENLMYPAANKHLVENSFGQGGGNKRGGGGNQNRSGANNSSSNNNDAGIDDGDLFMMD